MTITATAGTPGVNRFSRNQLLRTARLIASDPRLRDLVDLGSSEPTWHRLDATALLSEGEGRSFGRHHVHNVTNLGDRPALSVHVYSPKLEGITRYVVLDGTLRHTSTERSGGQW